MSGIVVVFIISHVLIFLCGTKMPSQRTASGLPAAALHPHPSTDEGATKGKKGMGIRGGGLIIYNLF